MAKKKTTTRRRTSKKPAAPQHSLPAGFWRQVGAILSIAVALLLIVGWFGAGGPFLNSVHQLLLGFIGYAVFVLPILMIYLAIETFKSKDNRIPIVIQIASFLFILWTAGLTGLIVHADGSTSGGWLGEQINGAMLGLVVPVVAGFIYVLLLAVTAMFVFSINPETIVEIIKNSVREEARQENARNVKVMRRAATVEVDDGVKQPEESKKKKPALEIKLGTEAEAEPTAPEKEKKLPRLTNLRGSTPMEKPSAGEPEKTALVMVNDPNWKSPSLDLLSKKENPADPGDIQQNAQIIQDTLADFKIDVEMEKANVGPKVTQYTLKPPSGVKLTKITALETNIALNLAAKSLRIEAPIPGQRAVGIEVPNRKSADVKLYSLLTSKQWRSNKEPLSFAVGKDISGQAVIGELNAMPHLMIAGQTGSGKSVMINTLLASLLYRNSPSDMKLILVDPKQVEMAPFEDIPHLLTPVITDPEKTVSALKWAVNEMERRYKLLAEDKLRNIKSYNEKIAKEAKKIPVEGEDGPEDTKPEEGKMPYIVIVIDELADLMMVASREVEALIVRLAQKARAVGIHLVLATQRPSVNVITGLIKANVPSRIAFTVASNTDSRTILDQGGAESLLGQGDMLLLGPKMNKPIRVQGAWVSDDEVLKITDHLRAQSAPQYNEEIISQPVHIDAKGGVVMDGGGSSSTNDTFKDAVRVAVENRKASTSLLQRKLGIGYSKAARIMDEMEEQGIIGPANGSKPREILVHSMEDVFGPEGED